MRRVYSSFEISLDRKLNLLKKLEDEDKSDWTEKTQAFCAAAHPSSEVKQAAWDNYFKAEKEWSYHALA